MELPTCPSCHQSVLDDDADECPFCGAPMRGGVAKSRAAAQPAPGAPASKTKSSSPSAPSAASGKGAAPNAAAEDDPFAVDPSDSAKALPLSPKPSGAKTLALTCPMCETIGYTIPKAAGQLVRCCNPNCMVPLFKAAAPKKDLAPAPQASKPARKPTPLSVYVVGGLFVVGLTAVSIWYLGPGSTPKPAAAPPSVAVGAPSGSGLSLRKPETAPADATAAKAAKNAAASGTNGAAADPPGDVAESIKKSLARGVEIALAAPAIRKAYCRRMAAMGAAAAGDWQAVNDQLEQLQRVGSQAAYEAIPAAVLLAWHDLGQSRPAFDKRLAELERLAETLPVRGRFATQAAISVAAVYAAAGKPEAAMQLLEKHRAQPLVEQLAGALEVAVADGSFSLDRSFPGRSLNSWEAAPSTSVTLLLCVNGRWDEALAWARSLADPNARDEAIIGWAEQMAQELLRQDKSSKLEKVRAAAPELSAPMQARLWAKIAQHYAAAGARDAALLVAGLAAAQLEPLAAPSIVKLGSAKSVLDARLTDALSYRQAADAAAETAAAQARLGQTAEAWQSIQKSLQFARGLGPGLIPVQARILQFAGEGADDIRNELKTALQLRNEDQIRRAISQYRQQLTDLAQAAQVRYRAQGRILEFAAELGLLDQVWDEVQRLDAKPDPNDREPFLSSAVPLIVAERYGAAGKAELREKIRKAVESRVDEADSYQVLRALPVFTQQLIDAGQLEPAIVQLNQSMAETGELQEWALRLCHRLVAERKEELAAALLANLQMVGLREDGYFLLAAQAAAAGRAAQFQAAVPSGISPSESAALHAGLVAGWSRLLEEK